MKCPYCEKCFDLEVVPRQDIKEIADICEKEARIWRPWDYDIPDSWTNSPDSITLDINNERIKDELGHFAQ